MIEPRYSFTVEGLELPRENVVLRWNWRKRHAETKRVANYVRGYAVKAGLGNAVPLAKARVRIVARGNYGRRDSGSTWRKDVLDSLIGLLIEDDSRKVIGDPEFVEEVTAGEASVRVEVWER